MNTNFKRLWGDLKGLFDNTRTTPKPLLFFIFLVPVGFMLKDLHTPGASVMGASMMYLGGGIVAWALIRGGEPDAPPAEKFNPMRGTIIALVLRLGGTVVLTKRDFEQASGPVVIDTTRCPDGTFRIEVRRHV